MAFVDTFGRVHDDLRISITDRCNLRCAYCMPEEPVWYPHAALLTFEELTRVATVAVAEGVVKLRVTGGEPLLRRDVVRLIGALAAIPGLADLSLTTNGVLLAAQAKPLRDAGLHRITVSLDTLDRERFRQMTRFDSLDSVLEGIDAAASAGFASLKIDTVVIRGVNDHELTAIIDHGRPLAAEVRFIEYMDVGGATRWSPGAVVSRREMLARLEQHYGPITPIVEQSSAPADRFTLPDGTVFGIISSTTEPFCDSCDRSRLTADGVWLMCLYASAGTDLRRPLRAGASGEELRNLISTVWTSRADRGAEERLNFPTREALIPVSALKKDAHLEMHTRGG